MRKRGKKVSTGLSKLCRKGKRISKAKLGLLADRPRIPWKKIKEERRIELLY